MFEKSAHLYDLAYSFKDYAGESTWVRNAIQTRVPQARSLLDVACGTGKHLEHLRAEFDCQGLDLNPDFVETRTAANRSQSAQSFNGFVRH